MAGQEGLEPPTPGFGVRCSTIRATGLLFCFFVWRVSLTKGTIFFQLKFVRNCFLIFGGCVVSLLTALASKGNIISHCAPPE